jgi:DNA-binding transcriptional LysR family regulator
MFASVKTRPRIEVECDGATSMLTELEAGTHIAVVGEMFYHVWGKRLVYRPLSNSTESHSIGIARATKGDVTPAGEKFCEILRKISKKPKMRRP